MSLNNFFILISIPVYLFLLLAVYAIKEGEAVVLANTDDTIF